MKRLLVRAATQATDAFLRGLLNTRAGRWLQSRAMASLQATRRTQVAQAQGVPQVVAVPEITPLVPRPSTERSVHRRLNLLIPALSERHVFGGIATALRCFEALQQGQARVRLIVLDEVRAEPSEAAWYGAWPQVEMEDDSPPDRHIVSVGHRHLRSLPVGPGDRFFATAWWTAHAAHQLLDWQAQQFGSAAGLEFLYLIQDYEPGFYPWSTRWALAAATYAQGHRIRAIVNTQMLADHLNAQGHHFARQVVLEPRLNPALAQWRQAHPVLHKEPVLMVYGRPGTERNAFGLILMALRLWVEQAPDQARRWQIVSAGEAFEPIDLGHGVTLHNLGKLSLDDYAQWLSRCAVGVSLMISPHPSYPPLEMASFGAQVITNRFALKNLSRLSSHITSLEVPAPQPLAQAIAQACTAFEATPADQRALSIQSIALEGAFLSGGDELQGCRDLLDGLG